MGGQFAENATTCPNFPEIFTAAIFDTAMMDSWNLGPHNSVSATTIFGRHMLMMLSDRTLRIY